MNDYIQRVAEAVREMASNIANEYAYLSGDDNAYSAANSIMSKIDGIDLDAVIATVPPDAPSGLMLDKGEVEFIAARVRRLCNEFNYSCPSGDDQFIVGVSASIIGAILSNRAIKQRVRGGHEPVGYVSQQDLNYLAHNSTTIISSKGMADDDETIPLYLASPLAVPDVSDMVNRFLGWKLPRDFGPDAGISFTPPTNPEWWPIGTNLFTATQAKQMFEYVLAAPRQENQP